MKKKLDNPSKRYDLVIRRSLKPGAKAISPSAVRKRVGVLADGLERGDLAKIHTEHLIERLSEDGTSSAVRGRMIERSFRFLAEAVAGVEQSQGEESPTHARLKKQNEVLNRKVADLNRRVLKEAQRRTSTQAALKVSESRYTRSQSESGGLHLQLRHLSHQILMAQEKERKEISRELHDQIAQTLTGINVHLAALKKEDAVNAQGLARKIVSTQKLVEKSVDIVHRYARELRPTVLDDLGLNPALRTYLKEFGERTSLRVRFKSVPEVERLSEDKRTVLYRVAQAALTNVGQHAKATAASVLIRNVENKIRMDVHDNGKGFNAERVLFAKRHKRLGVLGMRERVEMVGGTFSLKSAPGKGTTIRTEIPCSE